jgi:Helix-hairpin-helix motif
MPANSAGWTLPQRRALIALAICALAALSFQWLQRPSYLPANQPDDSVVFKIDPNSATIENLSTLPRLGMKRAADVVAYREEFAKTHPGQLAFTDASDLMKIRGIGIETARQLQPYLTFPSQHR